MEVRSKVPLTDKGTPVERRGRKALGLQRSQRNAMTARLPKECWIMASEVPAPPSRPDPRLTEQQFQAIWDTLDAIEKEMRHHLDPIFAEIKAAVLTTRRRLIQRYYYSDQGSRQT